MSRITTVYGSTGSGKSTFTKRALQGARRVIVFDTQDEYEAQGFVRCTSMAEVFEGAMADDWRGYRIAYAPDGEADMVAELHHLARGLRASQKAAGGMPATLVIEEANRGYPNQQMPADRRGVQALVLQGRHENINILAVSQRPSNVNPDLRGNADRMVVFRLPSKLDRQRLADEVGHEYINDFRRLKDHEYMLFERSEFIAKKSNFPI
ncbi:MAG: DUF87 domain-containing protein [Thalassobaculaceae bacterium]